MGQTLQSPDPSLQQLLLARGAVHHGLNLSALAMQEQVSPSGVSKMIRDLEGKLGADLFVRRGKKLAGVTAVGQQALPIIERIATELDNLSRVAARFAASGQGRLVIATTHNQASYVLPAVLADLARAAPDLVIEIRQGAPRYIADLLLTGEADLGLATEAVDAVPGLASVPAFAWDHAVVVPLGHPLCQKERPGLADIARFPLITYGSDFAGGAGVLGAFGDAGLIPDLRLSAMDSDVIKTYVRLGLGVGIVSQMALVNGDTDGLAIIPLSDRLFPRAHTKLAWRAGAVLSRQAMALARRLAPHLADDPALWPHDMGTPAHFLTRLDLHFEWRVLNLHGAGA